MASLAELRMEEPDEIVASEPEVRPEELRILEALLFASAEPLEQATLAKRMPEGVDIKAALAQLQAEYANRGVNLVRVANKWTFRTAGDLAWLMTRESTETRKLSRAAIEVLAIVAYHQPVTRAEIEEIRGVVTSKGTLDVLLETGWIKPRGRRKTPGRPLTFGTTDAFLAQFSLETLGDLPGLEELKGTGLLDSRLPTGFTVPTPSDDPTLRDDEEPLDPGDLDLALAPAVEVEAGEAEATEATTAEAEATVAEADVSETGSIETLAETPEVGTVQDDAAVFGEDTASQVVGDLELSAADAEAEIAEVSLEVQELDGDALKDLALEAEELIAEQDDEVVAELVDATAEAEGEAELSDEAEAEIDGEAADDEGDRDTGEDDSSHRG
ncbi:MULTISPECIES: SMC-Scp complex subunit ScpB [Bradyrhizobium]|jgi:segregation and condensation protein B|uniref:SMC-Scp complex subunit ScpB n=1 Tax=Bradyrhizobium denitrificans TaxID=2734912 RepID=A0ABS5G3L6_9BRAD|nr:MULTISPECIES: SMC-Scp complex subunit ScpB [Bradyrhizobium]MBR1135854.1 SMC-Scp complex subunit ScpB [Bradyrhizobium denitrificans]MDU1492068.1 SMC-Scp complex subunit ScpB [Bradyrhizobium sp.]MDU1542709.1 SMC-Scp complex subunit ScpB [Bradyrhizobium sp.]MDU1691448.1 SMC-Scp complex subunit ScpB [Bradyrhizobium sp.]MDU1808640.1 SMC-Scp complex subunit ScpB [Bradyrhizobium sp.]